MDKEKFSQSVSDALRVVFTSSILAGSSAYLDLAIMINWNRIISKEQIAWATAFFGLPTLALNALVIYVVEINIRKLVKNTKKALTGKEEIEVIAETPHWQYFSTFEDGAERKMKFGEEINIEGHSSLTIQFDEDHHPDFKYKSKRLWIEFRDIERTIQFPWGIHANMVKPKEGDKFKKGKKLFPENFPTLRIGLRKEHFCQVEFDGNSYWQLQDTPLFFSQDMHTLFLFKNGQLEKTIQFEECENEEKLEPEFLD